MCVCVRVCVHVWVSTFACVRECVFVSMCVYMRLITLNLDGLVRVLKKDLSKTKTKTEDEEEDLATKS